MEPVPEPNSRAGMVRELGRIAVEILGLALALGRVLRARRGRKKRPAPAAVSALPDGVAGDECRTDDPAAIAGLQRFGNPHDAGADGLRPTNTGRGVDP